MATRSTIAIENLDGTVHQIYCHWDGYISYNGVILNKYYNTRELVEKLIMGAAISSLGRYIPESGMDFDSNDVNYTKYYSYRGEITEIRHFKDFNDYEENHQYEEFEYLYTKDGVWSVFDGRDWRDLEYIIQSEGYKDVYEN